LSSNRPGRKTRAAVDSASVSLFGVDRPCSFLSLPRGCSPEFPRHPATMLTSFFPGTTITLRITEFSRCLRIFGSERAACFQLFAAGRARDEQAGTQPAVDLDRDLHHIVLVYCSSKSGQRAPASESECPSPARVPPRDEVASGESISTNPSMQTAGLAFCAVKKLTNSMRRLMAVLNLKLPVCRYGFESLVEGPQLLERRLAFRPGRGTTFEFSLSSSASSSTIIRQARFRNRLNAFDTLHTPRLGIPRSPHEHLVEARRVGTVLLQRHVHRNYVAARFSTSSQSRPTAPLRFRYGSPSLRGNQSSYRGRSAPRRCGR